MKQIRLGIEKGLDVSIYDDNSKYNFEQMKIIRVGLQENLDVSWYAKPEFDYKQMSEIFLGLSEGLDVSIYAKHNMSANEMVKQRHKLELKKEFNKKLSKIFG